MLELIAKKHATKTQQALKCDDEDTVEASKCCGTRGGRLMNKIPAAAEIIKVHISYTWYE